MLIHHTYKDIAGSCTFVIVQTSPFFEMFLREQCERSTQSGESMLELMLPAPGGPIGRPRLRCVKLSQVQPCHPVSGLLLLNQF